MPTKNAVTKNWSLVPSPTGQVSSSWPLGNKPGFRPRILLTDIIDGPISGGEGNKGCYLTIIGWNLGKFADWGVTNHLYINGQEVDNYRCLTACAGDSVSQLKGYGVTQTFGLQRLTMQVGGLGGSTTFGTAYPITLSVGVFTPDNPTDVSGNYLGLADLNALVFTPTQGTIMFVDPLLGDDSNLGTFASPKQSLQGSAGTSGAARSNPGNNTTGGTPAGQHTILMGGLYGSVRGSGGSWCNLFRISGTPPAAGTNRGNLVFTSYPGAAGANAPQLAVWNPGSGVSAAGGFLGNDTHRGSNSLIGNGSVETNPYDGQPGWGRDIVCSNLKIISPPDAPRDGCPFNFNSDADRWRVVNNDASWQSTLGTPGGDNGAKGGCVAGNGLNPLVAANYFHDVTIGDGSNQNHFVYIDGSNVCAIGAIVAFNCMRHNTGGNGVQSYTTQGGGTYIAGMIVHNNWIEDVNKHCLNFGDNTGERTDFSNICIGAGEACVNMSGINMKPGSNSFKIFNNTFCDWGRVIATRAAVWNQGGTPGSSTDLRNNIFYRRAGQAGTGGFTSLDGTGTNNLSNNLWFDATGNAGTTAPDAASGGRYLDPLFTSLASKDFTPSAGSPAIDAGTTNLSTRTFDFFGRIITDTADIGAIEVGAYL